MEHKLPEDFFEEFLKDATSSFIMTPSRRVWNSIYNNLHPSKKNPSFSSSLLICGLIFLIGFLHSEKIIDNSPEKRHDTIHSSAAHTNMQPLLPSNATVGRYAIKSKSSLIFEKLPVSSEHSKRKIFRTQSRSRTLESAPNSETINDIEIESKAIHKASGNVITENMSAELENTFASTLARKNDNFYQTRSINPLKQNNNGGFSFQLYATPSYGYRSINRSTDPVKPSSLVVNAAAVNESFTFRHSPALNLEAGGTVLMPINKDVRVKAGMQFNYTNFKIVADESPNQFITQLQVSESGNHTVLESHLTNLSNVSNINPAGSFFNSNTYQVSLPIGTDVRIMGNNNVQWFAGATIQPSYLIGSSPFLISADMKNYVSDADFVRKWNMNTSIETFVSYRLKSGAMFNVGPQLRYQLFSTYDKRYSYNEKLYSIGVKVGITRNF